MNLQQLLNDKEMNEYLNCIMSKAYKRYGINKIMDYQDIEDFKQECYIELLEALSKYNEERSGLKTFIQGCINITALNISKRYCAKARVGEKSKLSFSCELNDDLVLGDVIPDNTNIESEIIAGDMLDFLMVKYKNDSCSIDIIQYLIEGYNPNQIKKELGLSNNKVYKRIEKIKADIEEYWRY